MVARRDLIHFLFESVRGRLALLVAGITLTAVFFGIVLSLQAYRNERASVEKHLRVTARAVSILVDRQLGELEALVKGLATSPYLAAGNVDGLDAAARQLAAGDLTWIVLVDPSGQQLINTSVSRDTTLPRAEFDPDVATAFDNGRTYISNLTLSAVKKRHVLYVAIPVTFRGVPRHFLGVVTTPAALAQALAVQQIAPGGVLGIVDRKGTIATRSRSPEQYVGGSATPDIVAAIPHRTEGLVESVTLEGIPVLTAFSRSPISGWSVLNAAPRADLYASARGLIMLAIGLSTLLLFIAIFLAGWIGRAVVRGVDTLVANTNLIGDGGVPPDASSGLAETDYVAAAMRSTSQRLLQREQELKHLNEELEQRVTARTQQLAEANHELVIANRELEDFARVASHDLREPLRSITAFASTLKEESTPRLNSDERYYVERIVAAAERMRRLLDSIFAYSKVTTPKRDPVPVDLNRVVAEVIDDLGMRLKETSGKIEASPLDTVSGDPRELHQLIMNLVANGLKFHRPGVPPIVQVGSSMRNGHVLLVVSDNGIGFDPREAERIFVPFERLHPASVFEGTGMGLAIVRRIAERHGGSVSATSTPGSGSRFEVMLPRAAAAPPRS
jgi:signal transduction histidine kinase